jgi:PTH1 family peptidyl-tRNA hydrolase
MLLLVGLGNPGKEYAGNRHNIGFMAADEIIRRQRLSVLRTKTRPHGVFSEGVIGSEKVVVLKPLSFMNESGRPVAEAIHYWRIEPKDVFVFYDELDLAPAKIRTRRGGGAAGHNGIRSIDKHIGNDFWRIRLGIGHPGEKRRVTGHVLHDFSKSDKTWLEPMLEAVADAVPILLTGDGPGFMTKVALLTQPPKPPKKPAPDAAGPEISERKKDS